MADAQLPKSITPVRVGPGDPWPIAVSDGVLLACVDCGHVPSFDYHVTDAFWREHVRDEGRLGVVCLPCLGRRCDGVGLAEAIEFVQWVGPGVTVEMVPTRAFTYEQRVAAFSTQQEAGRG